MNIRSLAIALIVAALDYFEEVGEPILQEHLGYDPPEDEVELEKFVYSSGTITGTQEFGTKNVPDRMLHIITPDEKDRNFYPPPVYLCHNRELPKGTKVQFYAVIEE